MAFSGIALLKAQRCCLAGALAIALLAGCKSSALDLQSVRALQKTADDARVSYAALAEDYYDSCVRRVEYENIASSITGRLASGAKTPPAPEPPSRACRAQHEAAAHWRRANDVLLDYFDALGALAGGQEASDTYALKHLAAILTENAALDSRQADALKTLATTTISGIYEAKRKHALGAYITAADQALGQAADALKAAAKDHYEKIALRQEGGELEAFFNDNFIATRSGIDALEALRYASTWSDKRKELDERYAAADAYVDSLTTLRRAHADLLAAIDKNDRITTSAIAKSLIEELAPSIEAMRKPFGEKS